MSCVLRTFRCHVCHEDKTTRVTLYNHFKRHDIPHLPPQPPLGDSNTRGSSFYQFISKDTILKQPNLQHSLIFVCAICNSLHSSIDILAIHFDTHCTDPSTQTARSTTATPITTTPTSSITSNISAAPTSQKRKNDTILDSNQVKIIKGSKTIVFDTSLSTKIVPLNTPRVTKADRDKLANHYILRMQSIHDMNEGDTAIIQAHQDNQQRISCFTNHHPYTLNIVNEALSLCKSTVMLNDYEYPKLSPAATQDQQSFYRMVKHILVDFSSKCFRRNAIYSNHERTFFADRVLPIFSAFENHHPNIHFEWCEKAIKSLQTVTFMASDFQRATPCFADGIGYSTLVGHMDDERVVFEASSGGANEDTNHTQDDAMKLVRTLTSFLVLKAYDLKNARFQTLLRYTAISIQIIKRKITLSTLSLNEEKKFVFEERRSVTVPIFYQERFNWFQVFEMLADFEQLLKDQDEVEGILREENAVGVIPAGEETVRIVFEAKQHDINSA